MIEIRLREFFISGTQTGNLENNQKYFPNPSEFPGHVHDRVNPETKIKREKYFFISGKTVIFVKLKNKTKS